MPRPSSDAPALEALAPAAGQLGVRLLHIDVKGSGDFERAFREAKGEGVEAVLLLEGPRAVGNRTLVAGLALKNRLPMMSQFAAIVGSGGLMAYGPDLDDLFRRAAGHVDKILKGAKPAELPIEQPTKFELIINLKTARALGVTIPPSLRLRADRVIE